jgi:hypothetical protein
VTDAGETRPNQDRYIAPGRSDTPAGRGDPELRFFVRN